MPRLSWKLPSPTRILFVTSIHTTVLQYVMADIADAFTRLGHKTLLLKETSPQEPPEHYSHRIDRALADFDPHVCFQMDHLRYEWPGIKPSAYFITYIQDLMPSWASPRTGQRINPNDAILVDTEFKWWKPMFDQYDYPKQNIIHLPSCTNELVFRPQELTEQDRAKYGADVAVVTNIELDQRGYWDNLSNQAQQSKWPKHLLRKELVYQMWQTVANGFYRLTPVERLAPLGLNMKIWGKFPQKEHPTLGKYFMGPVSYEELPKIYQASKIVLLGNHAGWRHYKTPSVLAAGGFPMVRYHPDSCEDIIVRDWMMFGKDTLIDKVRLILKDEDLRQRLIATCRSVVLADRTYYHQMNRILHIVTGT